MTVNDTGTVYIEDLAIENTEHKSKSETES